MASNYGLAPHVIYDSAQASYWTNQQYVNSPTLTSAPAADINLSQCTVQFQRTEATGVREDIAEFSLYMWVNSGVYPPTAPVNAAQAATVEGFLDTWWTTEKTLHTSHWVLSGYTWRNISAAGPISSTTGRVLPGPAWRVTTRSVAGTGAGPGAFDQSSMTLTFTTASRRHWGRVYLPSTYSTSMSSMSRIATATVDSAASAADTLFNSMGTNAAVIVPVVWSSQYRGMLTFRTVKIDDVPDVVRRRRPKIKTYEKAYTNSA